MSSLAGSNPAAEKGDATTTTNGDTNGGESGGDKSMDTSQTSQQHQHTSMDTTSNKSMTPDKLKLNEAKNLTFDCDLCNVKGMHAPTYHQHMAGKNHAKRLRMLEQSNSRSVEGGMADSATTDSFASVASSGLSKINVQYRCEICNINLVSESQLEAHVAGIKHKKKLARVMPFKEHETTTSQNQG